MTEPHALLALATIGPSVAFITAKRELEAAAKELTLAASTWSPGAIEVADARARLYRAALAFADEARPYL